MTIRIVSAQSVERFVGTEQEPRQVLRVVVEHDHDDALTEVAAEVIGAAVAGEARSAVGPGSNVVEVPFTTDAPVGAELPASVRVRRVDADGRAAGEAVEAPVRITVAEPGWTMVMVPHFHYDPVWWNTQASYTQTWELQGNDGTTRPVWENNAFHLVRAHLDMALADDDYTFVLAEVDYLKPFWDVYPQYREVLRDLIDAGRVEVMGGTYNEPNTNLTGLETTIRNLVYGIGYQRDIMGADPRTAWQLDVFGHDPQFPGLVADAGLSSTSWARGPFHQWGPILSKWNESGGDVRNMQFPAEFEWLSPSGRGVVTHYMPNHYSAGWWMDSSATLDEAEQKVYELFLNLKPAAATKTTLLPVGTDYTPPNKWVTRIHRDWNARYVWPRFVTGVPRDFFSAVHAELESRGVRPSPQTRDMNPIYTGKDVSYIDTKQAQRAAEVAATDAEKLATFASLLGCGRYPSAALDKVWRQLAYGAHHDAITGSESDQVYIDLITGWREAHDLAVDARDRALSAILARVDTTGEGWAVTVANTLAFQRTDVARASFVLPSPVTGLRLVDDGGVEVPFLVDAKADERVVIAFVASDVPGMGWRTWRLVPDAARPLDAFGWQTVAEGSAASGLAIVNEFYEVTADSARGGGLDSIVELATGRPLLKPGDIGNELRLYEEYPQHPEFGEGPWHLVPNGQVVGSASRAADSIRIEVSPIGQRIVVAGTVGEVRYEQRNTLWRGVDRLDLRTRVLDFTGADRLLRVRFPVDVPGSRPVSEVAGAVVARGFGLPESDAASAPWTLDNPANTFFAASSTAHLALVSPAGEPLGDAAIAIAEVVVQDLAHAAPDARDLVTALARVGVTATTTTADGPRYGWLHVDSNLPDIRLVLGGPETNPVTAEILARAGNEVRAEFFRQVSDGGSVRLFVPAETSVEQAWVPNADLRDVRSLPALIVAGVDRSATEAAVESLAHDFATGTSAVAVAVDTGPTALLDQHTVGLLTYGIPGFAVDPAGAMHLSLMRSCTGWPSGIWLDPPLRRAPDGSAFQLQHWTHDFDYALVSGGGDWRSADLVSRGAAFSTPLHARRLDARGGSLPGHHALLTLTPERVAQVTTVKPTGNAHAHGSGHEPAPDTGVTLRLVESTGLTRTIAVASAFGPFTFDKANLLERGSAIEPERSARDEESRSRVRGDLAAGEVLLDGAEISTLVGVPHGAARSTRLNDAPVLGPTEEIAQPVYSRYWLHNRGPAPMGFMPVSVSAETTLLRAEGGEIRTSVAVANQLTDTPFAAELVVDAPSGWQVEPESRPVSLEPGGYTRFPLTMAPPPGTEPGTYFVRVQVPVGGDVIEDVISVLVPGGAGDGLVPPAPGTEIDHGTQTRGTTSDAARATGLEITSLTDSLTVVPGQLARLVVGMANRTRGRIDGEAMAISPWGTWSCVGPYAAGFAIEPGGSGEVVFDLDVPIDAEPGHWWVMVKLMWFGRAQYSVAVPVVIGSR